jgi:hypothetical protein
MEHTDMSPRYRQILRSFACLPEKMLSFHSIDNVTEFVLHALCHEQCLNLAKAAYFIDNPDFDCLKGIAGFSKQNQFSDSCDVWSRPQCFTKHMQACTFNQKVRSILVPSAKKLDRKKQELVDYLAHELAMHNPLAYIWNNKHNNHALILFERHEQDKAPLDSDILQGFCLLGFCPIF